MYKIVSFVSDSHNIKSFLSLPYRIYENDIAWIPEFKRDVISLIMGYNPLNIFLKNKNFIIYKLGKAVGRAIAFINHRINIDGFPLGTIGYYECEDDKNASRILFESALEWLYRQGARTVWGPMNGTVLSSYRLHTAGSFGSDRLPFFTEPYNPEYYIEHFERAGFNPIKRWRSTLTTEREHLLNIIEKTNAICSRYRKTGFKFRFFNPSNFENDLKLSYEISQNAFAGNLGYHPTEYPLFAKIMRPAKWIFEIEQYSLSFLLDPNGKECGFVTLIPDYSMAIRAMKGNKKILSSLKFIFNRKKTSDYIGLLLCVNTETRRKYPGLGRVLLGYSAEAIYNHKGNLICAFMSEDSNASSYTESNLSFEKHYTLYGKALY